MIRLTRQYAGVPASLRAAKRRAKERVIFDLALANTLSTKSYKTSDWKPAKKALIAETSGKCAYCEATATTVTFGDVEHFRPKSVYWWLAYSYDNYSFGCQICNQSHKRNRFDCAAARMAPPSITTAWPDAGVGLEPGDSNLLAAFIALARAEQALVVDPYLDDVASFFIWETDDVLKATRIAPRAARGFAHRKADTTIATLGLNRPELVGSRYTEFLRWQGVADALKVIPTAHQPPIIAGVRAQLAREPAFKGMATYFLTEIWGIL